MKAAAFFSLSWGAGAAASASVFICGGTAVEAAAFFSLSSGAGAAASAAFSLALAWVAFCGSLLEPSFLDCFSTTATGATRSTFLSRCRYLARFIRV